MVSKAETKTRDSGISAFGGYNGGDRTHKVKFWELNLLKGEMGGIRKTPINLQCLVPGFWVVPFLKKKSIVLVLTRFL